MNKLAQVREQEVRGVLAALVDKGHVKVASRGDFDKLAYVVAENVGYEYDVNDIIGVTGAVLNGGMDKTAGMQKTAARMHESNCYAALGELLLMKTAGMVDDGTFVKEAEVLTDAAAEASGVADAIEELPEEVQDAVLEALVEEALAEDAAQGDELAQ